MLVVSQVRYTRPTLTGAIKGQPNSLEQNEGNLSIIETPVSF